jgi:hypothetical protein
MNRSSLLNTFLVLMILFGSVFCFTSEVVSLEEEELILSLTEPVVRKTEKGLIVSAEGQTNLPDEAELWVFLKREGFYVTGRKTVVKDGQFQADLGPFSKRFHPAVYEIEVSFMPRRQKTVILAGIPQAWTKEISAQSEILKLQDDRVIEETEKRLYEELGDIFEKTEELYSELNITYNKFAEIKEEKGTFAEFDWRRFSRTWQSRLDELDRLNRQRNRDRVIALFPSLERKLDGLTGSIRLLETLYLRKLLDREEEEIAIEDLKIMIEDEFLLLRRAFQVDNLPGEQKED